MKRVWKPLDVRRMRLYTVHQYFSNHPQWNKDYIVAATKPTQAAQILEEALKESTFIEQPYYRGEALNIFQPESWVNGPTPNPDLDNCKHENMGFVQSGRFSGDFGNGREYVSICLDCGLITVSGDRNGESFQVSIHFVAAEQLEAIKRWVDYVNGESADQIRREGESE